VGVNGPLSPGHGWWQVRTLGAAALDISLVAKGALDGYVDTVGHGCWDYLAALLVCREAGAIVVDALGRNIVVLDPDERRMPLAAGSAEMLESVRRAWAASRP
jgi:fructose-1,6-bisphosphatase/inositol monophosphatase family enzyme